MSLILEYRYSRSSWSCTSAIAAVNSDSNAEKQAFDASYINLTMMEMIAITQIHVKPRWKLLLTPPIIGCFDPVGPVNEES